VKSKRRCDKGQPACGRCVKQRYLCTYRGRLGTGTGAVLGNSCTFMPPPQPGPFPTASFGADIGTLLMPDPAAFQLNTSSFDSLLAAVPESNDSFLTNTWPSRPPQTSSTVQHDKTLTRKDYSNITPACVRTSAMNSFFFFLSSQYLQPPFLCLALNCFVGRMIMPPGS
jgi:hypothetical protein